MDWTCFPLFQTSFFFILGKYFSKPVPVSLQTNRSGSTGLVLAAVQRRSLGSNQVDRGNNRETRKRTTRTDGQPSAGWATGPADGQCQGCQGLETWKVKKYYGFSFENQTLSTGVYVWTVAFRQALVAEIERNQVKLDECQTHSKQYCTSVKVNKSIEL